MQRFPVKLWRKVGEPAACEVLINLRGSETKRTIGHLLYDHLSGLKVKTLMGRKKMGAGEKMVEEMEKAVEECKLSLLVQANKRIVPIFYDVKPSQLQVRDHYNDVVWGCTANDLHRDWSELLRNASDAIIWNLLKEEEEQKRMSQL
ncbi:TMV resistance protein N [Senna tora]|uniref:TMV resistance protein N n=1 Tax=Senna tora TaxID=362788 RepID=A0A834XEP1_9FABA|nr:TMV resistance protein N [Senna tora]